VEEAKEVVDVEVAAEVAIAGLLVVAEAIEEVVQEAAAEKGVVPDVPLLIGRCPGVAVDPILHLEGNALALAVVQIEPKNSFLSGEEIVQ